MQLRNCFVNDTTVLLTVEELLEGIPAAEEVSEDVERVPEDEVQTRIHAAKRIALQIEK